MSEPTVTLFADEAAELARILELFGEYAARGGDQAITDLSEIAYGDHIPGYLQWTEEALVWAGRLALQLKHQAAHAAAPTTNGDHR
jgi:hypothetical protein